MPYKVIQPTDFTGKFAIAQSTTITPLLQKYITDHEVSYLNKLLGKALADLYVADLTDGIPAVLRFQTIHEYFYQDDYEEKVKESFGIKDMLLGFIFYHFIAETQVKHTQSGVTKQQSEVSNHAAVIDAYAHAERRYNDSVITYRNIQNYIKRNLDVYPEFKGIDIKARLSWLL